MPPARLGILLFFPIYLFPLSLDQKISLKLIESLWEEGKFSQAEQEIDRFLIRNDSSPEDITLSKLKADLYIKKRDYSKSIQLLEKIDDHSNFVKERKILCYYELKNWEKFLNAFEKDPSLLSLAFGKKIWDVGLAEAIQAEQNLDRKKLLLEKASHLYSQDLEKDFDSSKALSLAVIHEDNKDYQKAFHLYEDLFAQTNDEAYQLSMARMASHFNPTKALQILETLRWKSQNHGTSAALFSMEILEKTQDFHALYHLSMQELKLAPEGYRKAKIALYHLKSLFYLKCFDRIPEFYSAYNPHKLLNNQDQILAVSLASKAYLMKNEDQRLLDFYQGFKNSGQTQAQITSGRLLAKHFLEQKDFSKAQPMLNELLQIDVLHKDEYLTTLGLCYLNSQGFEVAESYFYKVASQSPDQILKKKSLDHLLSLPKLSEVSLNFLKAESKNINLKEHPKAVFWIVEALKAEKKSEEALNILQSCSDESNPQFHQVYAELIEESNLSEAISHYQKALSLSRDDSQKAFLHSKLFNAFFDHNKDLAAEHLFQSFSFHSYAIPDQLFSGLASHLYTKAFRGVKIYLNEESSKHAASQLVRLFSYKPILGDSEKIIYGKTLKKLCRFEESETVLKNGDNFYQKIELAKVLNHLGKYKACDELFDQLLKEKPYTLYQEGQIAFLAKICTQLERFKSQTDSQVGLDEIEKQIRVLKVCIQDDKHPLAFEIELIKRLFISTNQDDYESLRFHPYLDAPENGSSRKILNFIINKKLDKSAALSIEEPLSDTMEWILVQLFGKVANE